MLSQRREVGVRTEQEPTDKQSSLVSSEEPRGSTGQDLTYTSPTPVMKRSAGCDPVQCHLVVGSGFYAAGRVGCGVAFWVHISFGSLPVKG